MASEADTHTHTHTYIRQRSRTKRFQETRRTRPLAARAWFKNLNLLYFAGNNSNVGLKDLHSSLFYFKLPFIITLFSSLLSVLFNTLLFTPSLQLHM